MNSYLTLWNADGLLPPLREVKTFTHGFNSSRSWLAGELLLFFFFQQKSKRIQPQSSGLSPDGQDFLYGVKSHRGWLVWKAVTHSLQERAQFMSDI